MRQQQQQQQQIQEQQVKQIIVNMLYAALYIVAKHASDVAPKNV